MGFWAVIPPAIVITLTILTKNIFLSLIVGIVTGLGIFIVGSTGSASLIVSRLLPMAVDFITDVMTDKENVTLIFFLAVLGAIIEAIKLSGCTEAFSAVAVKRIRKRAQAQLMALLLGCLIFIDDYLNAITVGNMMMPITDKLKISRAKLSYIIDSTAAPVTVLAPVSSWVATVLSLMVPTMAAYGFHERGMETFIHACAYNFYAWFTLLTVFLVAVKKFNIGPMSGFEKSFINTGRDKSRAEGESVEAPAKTCRKKGTAFDLIFLMALLVALSILFMVTEGGFFHGVPLRTAFVDCDTIRCLSYASVITLLMSFIIFVFFGKLSLKQFDTAFILGIKKIMPPICMLVLSWTFSNILSDRCLGTGKYIADSVGPWLPAWLMPAMIFVMTAFMSFTTSVSWGAMAIMLPISITLCATVDPSLLHMAIGATLAGTVFGDHCSPLSDTTVLSSAGAGCNHLDHVVSQMPYAMIAGGVSTVSFIAAGLTGGAAAGFLTGAALLLVAVFVKVPEKLKKHGKTKIRLRGLFQNFYFRIDKSENSM